MNKDKLIMNIKNYIKEVSIKEIDLIELESENDLLVFLENIFYLELSIRNEGQDYFKDTFNDMLELDIEADIEFVFSLDKDTGKKEDEERRTIKNIPMKVKNILYGYDEFWKIPYEYLERALYKEGITYNDLYDQGDAGNIELRVKPTKEGKQ